MIDQALRFVFSLIMNAIGWILDNQKLRKVAATVRERKPKQDDKKSGQGEGEGAKQMEEVTKLLIKLPYCIDWTDRWLTVPQMAEELERIGFWKETAVSTFDQDQRLQWLQQQLNSTDEEGSPIWCEIGGQYKHPHQMTDADWADNNEFTEDQKASLFDMMYRDFVLEEPLPNRPKKPREPLVTPEDFVTQMNGNFAEIQRLAELVGFKAAPEVDTPQEKAATRAANFVYCAARASFLISERIRTGIWSRATMPEEAKQIQRLTKQLIELYEHVPEPDPEPE